MARTKNRGLQQSFSPSYTVHRWRLGEYIRLSKEDLKKGKDDSNSVINQRDLLNDFYQKHIGEFESVSEYETARWICCCTAKRTAASRRLCLIECIVQAVRERFL